METLAPIIFSLAAGVAGWHYMFYSRAASNLGRIEAAARNLRRVRLRRVNGFFMIVLGVLFLAGFRAVDPVHSASAFLAVWLAVFVVLVIIVSLVLVDMRLTMALRHGRPVDLP